MPVCRSIEYAPSLVQRPASPTRKVLRHSDTPLLNQAAILEPNRVAVSKERSGHPSAPESAVGAPPVVLRLVPGLFIDP